MPGVYIKKRRLDTHTNTLYVPRKPRANEWQIVHVPTNKIITWLCNKILQIKS